MVGKARFVDFAVGVTFGDIQVGSPRFAQVFGHEFTIRIKHFTEPKKDRIAFGGFESDANQPREVLPHVNQIGIFAHMLTIFGG